MPSIGALAEVAATFKDQKEKRGRKSGQRATTKEEDKIIKQKFHKLRPPGHGIDSRSLHKALPKKVAKKISKKTVIRRLGEIGFTAQMKLKKNDFSTVCSSFVSLQLTLWMQLALDVTTHHVIA